MKFLITTLFCSFLIANYAIGQCSGGNSMSLSDGEIFVVPAGVTSISVEIKGAEGGTGGTAASVGGVGRAGGAGGEGATLIGSFQVSPGDNLFAIVGEVGEDGLDGTTGGIVGGGGAGGAGGSALTNQTANHLIATAAGGGGGEGGEVGQFGIDGGLGGAGTFNTNNGINGASGGGFKIPTQGEEGGGGGGGGFIVDGQDANDGINSNFTLKSGFGGAGGAGFTLTNVGGSPSSNYNADGGSGAGAGGRGGTGGANGDGGAGGGGGGYRGGNLTQNNSLAQGGESFYNNTINIGVPTNTPGANSGSGSVMVCWNTPGSVAPDVDIHTEDGDVFIENFERGVIFKSQNGSCWRMTIDDNGNQVISSVSCP